MGYDFMFMTVRNAWKKKFPLGHSEVPPSDCPDEIPWSAFRAWLIERGGRENGGENSIWVDYANEGSINFSVDSSSVYLDTHAHWNDVLAAYLVLKSLNRDATILDCQDGRYHNEASFRALMKRQDG